MQSCGKYALLVKQLVQAVSAEFNGGDTETCAASFLPLPLHVDRDYHRQTASVTSFASDGTCTIPLHGRSRGL
jgi:hypothetical protein